MFKKTFGIFFLTYSLLAPAMAVPGFNPGTVIDHINQAGQFTVTLPDTAKIASGMPIFTTKGIPVIVSIVVGNVSGNISFWALTTGTGYLLLSHYNPAAPYVAAVTGGLGYAAGQEMGNATQGFMQTTWGKASQLALLTTLAGASMLTTNSVYGHAFLAATQALGLHTALTYAQQLLPSKTNTRPQSQNGIFASIKNMVSGGVSDALYAHTAAAMAHLAQSCDPSTLLHILLYEQAYRLALAGSSAAKKLFPH